VKSVNNNCLLEKIVVVVHFNPQNNVKQTVQSSGWLVGWLVGWLLIDLYSTFENDSLYRAYTVTDQ